MFVCMSISIFQKVDLNLNNVYTNIANSIKIPKNFGSKIVLGIGHCRSGSTFTMRLMGCSQVKSFHQPLKTILRWQMQNRLYNWIVPSDNAIYVKETIGPYTNIESSFDPIQVILRIKGIDLDNIHLIYLVREPQQTLASWINEWAGVVKPKQLIINFILSYITLQNSRNTAMSIFGRNNVHDLAYDLNSKILWEKLFSKIGFKNTPVVSNWSKYPPMGENGSNVYFPPYGQKFVEDMKHDVPQIFRKSMASHKNADEKNGIDINIYTQEDLSKIPIEYIELLKQFQIECIYNEVKKSCIKQLDL